MAISTEAAIHDIDSLPRQISLWVLNSVVGWVVYSIYFVAVTIIPVAVALRFHSTAQFAVLMFISWGMVLSQLRIKGQIDKFPFNPKALVYFNLTAILIIVTSASIQLEGLPVLAAAVAILGPVGLMRFDQDRNGFVFAN